MYEGEQEGGMKAEDVEEQKMEENGGFLWSVLFLSG